MSSRPGEVSGRSELQGESSGRRGYPFCADCGSKEVRPSRSSYPRDKEVASPGTTGFWRCGNCGTRFQGPVVPERKHRHHSKDPLKREIDAQRGLKRWVFPLVVLVITVLLVLIILNLRDPGLPAATFPRQ